MRRKLSFSLLALFLGGSLFVFRPAAAQSIIYVHADATGASDGTSWMDAFVTLQAALDEAQAAADPIEVWVAAGVYRPARRTDSADPRTATFKLINEVEIYGGFDGSETSRQGRDPNPATNGTVLSGDIGTTGFSGDNAYHVVTASGVGPSSVLDGVTVTEGRANGPDFTDRDGAGMYSETGSPTLVNCRFVGNTAQGDGGGIYNWNGSSPAVTECLFDENTAGTGGGAISNGFMSSPLLESIVFRENTAGLDGGAVTNFESSPTLIDVTFNGNVSNFVGGALRNSFNSSPVLLNVRFAGNQADGGGGAMENWNSDPSVVNAVFLGNKADEGGAIRNDESSPILTNATFSGNLADDGFGGGEGGAISNRDQSFPEIRNSILWNNSARGSGDAVFLDGSSEPLVGHSIVEGGLPAGTFDAGHNLVRNPQFESDVDPDTAPSLNGDLRVLTNGAPGLDGADMGYLPPDRFDLDNDGNTREPIPVDIAGTNRLVDNNNDGTKAPDLGAYEAPSSVIPVELTRFSAEATAGIVHLTWQTASETNNAGFQIERRHEETKWTQIGFVEGAGTRSEVKTYAFEDDGLPSGQSTFAYRLRQVDFNGAAAYSNVIDVALPAPTELRLQTPYPNPAARRVTIGFAVPLPTAITFALYDVMGRRIVVLDQGEVSPGEYVRSLDVSGYANGLYLLRLKTEQGVVSKKVSVIH